MKENDQRSTMLSENVIVVIYAFQFLIARHKWFHWREIQQQFRKKKTEIARNCAMHTGRRGQHQVSSQPVANSSQLGQNGTATQKLQADQISAVEVRPICRYDVRRKDPKLHNHITQRMSCIFCYTTVKVDTTDVFFRDYKTVVSPQNTMLRMVHSSYGLYDVEGGLFLDMSWCQLISLAVFCFLSCNKCL